MFWTILATDRVRQALTDAGLERLVIERPYT
ncbi:hypothetical protein NOCARDAX2BIS_380101 [Nocardioides sp. AX2bis]|nr:hypothetical protein NOCARDAX2BIS_380101 [Nocardioides sp. AX2bis]